VRARAADCLRPAPLVLAFAFGLALITGIVFGAVPAWLATRTAPIDALRGAGRSTGDHASVARRALLIVQATLSVVLVASSTMLAHSLGNLEGQDFGFEIRRRVLVALNRPPAAYTPGKLAALYRDVEERLNRLPGAQGSGLALYNPLTDNWGEAVLVAGHPAPKPGDQVGASWDRVSASYLQNLGVKVARGRLFSTADNETAEAVAVVNDAFVRRFFRADEDPLDQHFGLDLPENVGTYRIVGIVRDAKFAGFALDRPAQPMFFVPLAQTVDYKNPLMKRLEVQSHFVRGLLLVTSTPPGTLEPQVTRALADADSNLTVTSVRTMQEQVDRSFDQPRAVASLAGLFGMNRGVGAGRDRTLRRHRVHGDAAHERDRHTDGARRRSCEGGRDGAARCVAPRCSRPQHNGADVQPGLVTGEGDRPFEEASDRSQQHVGTHDRRHAQGRRLRVPDAAERADRRRAPERCRGIQAPDNSPPRYHPIAIQGMLRRCRAPWTV
jgi:hypothetical protein